MAKFTVRLKLLSVTGVTTGKVVSGNVDELTGPVWFWISNSASGGVVTSKATYPIFTSAGYAVAHSNAPKQIVTIPRLR